MNRKVSIVIFLLSTIWGFAAMASDESVAVLQTSYMDMSSGIVDATASSEFHEAVLEGVESAGFTVTSGDVVAAAVSEHSFDGDCDRNCLNGVRSELGVSDVVFVQIKEDDTGIATRAVAITFAIRDDISRETSEGYAVVKTWLRGAVALALKEDVRPPQPTLMPDTSSVEPASNNNAPEGLEGETTVEITKDRPRRKIRPLPLIISASLTVAFGATAIVMDNLAHRSFVNLDNDIKDETLGSDDKKKMNKRADKIDNQKLMFHIFLGATAVGLVTTGIFAVFTDFSGSKNETLGLKPAFAVGKNSGALIIGGSF